MLKLLTLITLTAAIASGTPVFADDPQKIANLSRADFLDEYEKRYEDNLQLQKELLIRLSPDLGTHLNADPITTEELAAFECLYDEAAAIGQLEDLARQMVSQDILRARMEEDPDFDFASLMTDESLQEEYVKQVSDGVMTAMRDCGLVSLGQSRLDFTPEVWAVLQKAMQERGSLND